MTYDLNPESRFVQILKVLIWVGAFGILHAFSPLGTEFAFWGFALGATLAGLSSVWAITRHLRLWVVLVLGLVGLAFGRFTDYWVRDSEAVATLLGVGWTLRVSDLLFFGLSGWGALFITRTFSKRWRWVALVEVLSVVFLAAYVLFSHRDYHINRPFWFADEIFRLGLYPPDVFAALGVGLLMLAVLMTLQRPSAKKLLMSFLALLLMGGLGYWLTKQIGGVAPVATPTASLMGEGDQDADSEEDEDGEGGGGSNGGSNDSSKGEGSGGGSGGGNGKNKNKNNKPPNNKPEPVAIVTFHDEPDLPDPIFYFRQNVQSRFDGTHLTSDASLQFDKDIITQFPTTEALTTEGRDLVFYTSLPTSMYLKTDHPQPISLGHASEIRPAENPNPSLFVAAYQVTSQMLSTDWARLLGRKSIPDSWSAEQRAYYTAHPDDPRYASLAEEILRQLDPRFQDEDIAKALVIKAYLEKEGFYTLKETHSGEDPTASFLFGSMRGYCVHFASAAAFLFRSQGIASRVAVGYAAEAARRGAGSSMMILGNMAHAWPEIHIEGVGWVTFDIYPERSDEPPATAVDADLTSMMGELARKDPTGGLAPDGKFEIDWNDLAVKALMVLSSLLGVVYLIKVVRRLMPYLVSQASVHRWALRAANDTLADVNKVRLPMELREEFATRQHPLVPSLRALVMLHYQATLGQPAANQADLSRAALTSFYKELRTQLPWWQRMLGWLNPIGWVRSR